MNCPYKIVALFFIAKLTGVKPRSATTQVLAIFVLSIASYILVAFCDAMRNLFQSGSFNSDLFADVQAKNQNMPITRIGCAIAASIVLSYMLSYAHRFNVINWIGLKIRATNRYGDEDVRCFGF